MRMAHGVDGGCPVERNVCVGGWLRSDAGVYKNRRKDQERVLEAETRGPRLKDRTRLAAESLQAFPCLTLVGWWVAML